MPALNCNGLNLSQNECSSDRTLEAFTVGGESCVKVPSATEFRFPRACIASDNSWAEILNPLDLVHLHADVYL